MALAAAAAFAPQVEAVRLESTAVPVTKAELVALISSKDP